MRKDFRDFPEARDNSRELRTDDQHPPDDLSVLHQIAGGDLQWFDYFAERYGRRLVAYLFSRVRDFHEAEELAQDVLLAVFHAARKGTFDNRKRDLSAWIFTIAHHRLVDHQRKRGRTPVTLESDVAAPGDERVTIAPQASADPVETVAQLEQARLVHAMIDQLPPQQQEVLRLKIFGELTFAAIAQLLACPEPTVKSRMRYALLRVRELLNVEGDQA